VVSSRTSIHEVDFCSQIASSVNILVRQDLKFSPIHEARVEGLGKGDAARKRKDLRFFDQNRKLILCGEVKLPGTMEGRSPFDTKLCEDAARKADNAGIQFFFTWNVNEFVLWDRSRWDRPLLDRRVAQWRLDRYLRDPQDVALEDNLKHIKNHFLPEMLRDVADIISGRRAQWELPPDDIFIQSLNSHLDWPIDLVGSYILEQADRNRAFGARIEQWMADQDWTFVRSVREEWIKSLNNMARTLAYIWANRLIFYKALRTRFPELPKLEMRPAIKTALDAMSAFNHFFQRAVDRSGDYEPLLMPGARDWATGLVFQPPNALDAWRGLLRGIDPIDFHEIPSDIVGRIFQKLISPEERHRFGQHFTSDDVVDLINVFCVRKADNVVLDPACGSGSFLVRAYYHKRRLDPRRTHLDLIGELFGCDIALYPAHLATLNLAAREINDEANYPRIARSNFFDIDPRKPFCSIPDSSGGQKRVSLPPVDAVVGNPPYVRQEKIEKREKERYAHLADVAFPDLHLSGRSDLHCYFWPAAARSLKADGYFGFLTSSSWLDVEYGFALQGWLLRHFRILAILESAAEPWFEDARVKTCVTILQRCEDESTRMANRVRFVRFSRRLADIIGVSPGVAEESRQAAFLKLRERIMRANADFADGDIRFIIKDQKALWEDGLRAASILGSTPGLLAESDDEESEEKESAEIPGSYSAGKWGRYLRAPDFYFDIMRRFGDRFVPLGEIAEIRFGVKSGCDAFFMPKDVTAEMLDKYRNDRAFREHTGGAPRKEVASGKLKIIQDGNGVLHPIEAEYVAPEVHSLMKVDRPVVRAADLDRVVLLVGEPLHKLRAKAPWAWRYIRYGSTATFASKKSKPVPLPKRSTCAGREPWYDLTGLVRPGIAFWPMAQQYRHIIAGNPERLICNHNLFDIAAGKLNKSQLKALIAILNSTVVGLFKTFYGRFAGTEGNLKTEVVDVNLMEVPDPRKISLQVGQKLTAALESMNRREIGRLVEEQLMECHDPERARMIAKGSLDLPAELKQPDRRALDEAVFELLGISDRKERLSLLDRLYEATARHFRDIRVVEIEKMEQRAKSDKRRLSIEDLAADIWDAAELEDLMPLRDWIENQSESNSEISIPEERPAYFPDNPLFELNTVCFGKAGSVRVEYRSREQAELISLLANLGLSGSVRVPSEKEACRKVLNRLNIRLGNARARFQELAESRTSDDRLRSQLIEILERWFILGREQGIS